LKCFGSWIARLGLDQIELTEKMQVFQAVVIQECNVTSSTIEVDIGTNVVRIHLDKVDLIDSCAIKHGFFYAFSTPKNIPF
jgi:hypothetical protein